MGLLVPLDNSIKSQRNPTSQMAESNNFDDYDFLRMSEASR
jgi:hypothetical protein